MEAYQKLKKSLISLSSVLAAMFATWTVLGEVILSDLCGRLLWKVDVGSSLWLIGYHRFDDCSVFLVMIESLMRSRSLERRRGSFNSRAFGDACQGSLPRVVVLPDVSGIAKQAVEEAAHVVICGSYGYVCYGGVNVAVHSKPFLVGSDPWLRGRNHMLLNVWRRRRVAEASIVISWLVPIPVILAYLITGAVLELRYEVMDLATTSVSSILRVPLSVQHWFRSKLGKTIHSMCQLWYPCVEKRHE